MSLIENIQVTPHPTGYMLEVTGQEDEGPGEYFFYFQDITQLSEFIADARQVVGLATSHEFLRILPEEVQPGDVFMDISLKVATTHPGETPEKKSLYYIHGDDRSTVILESNRLITVLRRIQ